MIRYVAAVFSMELRRLVSYRVDFWIQVATVIIAHLVVAYFLWDAIFRANDTTEMQGYTFHGILLYYLMIPLIDGVVRGQEITFFSREIYDGTFTRYLIYPISFFVYAITLRLAESMLAIGQLLLAVLMFVLLFGIPEQIVLGVWGAGGALLLALFAMLVYFQLATILELLAFWADNVWSLLVLLRFVVMLLGGGLIPLAFFPDWSQGLVHALPFASLYSLPIRTFLGLATTAEIQNGVMVLVMWSLVLLLPLYFFWRRGLRQYTGVGI